MRPNRLLRKNISENIRRIVRIDKINDVIPSELFFVSEIQKENIKTKKNWLIIKTRIITELGFETKYNV